MRKLFLSLLCLFILAGCSSETFSPNVAQTKEYLELNEEIEDHLSLVEDVDNVGLTFEIVSDNLDTSVYGEYTITYLVSLEEDSTEMTFTFIVKDEDAPEISCDDTIEILYGSTFVFSEYASAYDERDGDVSDSLYYEGTINTYSVGSYKITVYASDQFDNIATKEVTVVVKEDTTESYKSSLIGSYTDTSYTSDQSPVLTLNSDNTFELYVWYSNEYVRVDGTYMQYENVLYLIPDDGETVKFSYTAEENLFRLVIELDGTLTVDSRSDLVTSPEYNDTFEKD